MSKTIKVPLRGPGAPGLKVTAMAQLVPALTLLPQLLVAAKSPDAAICQTARAIVPALDKVTVCGALTLPTA